MISKAEKFSIARRDAVIREMLEWILECGEATARTEPMLERAREAAGIKVPRGKTLIEVLTETPK
jgi:hypothetical protein